MENLINFENFIMLWCFISVSPFAKWVLFGISSRNKKIKWEETFSFSTLFIALQKTQITIPKQNITCSQLQKYIFYKPIRQSRLEYDIYVFNIFKHKTFPFLLQLNAKCSLHVFKQGNQTFKSKKKSIGFLDITKPFLSNIMPLLGRGRFHVFLI